MRKVIILAAFFIASTLVFSATKATEFPSGEMEMIDFMVNRGGVTVEKSDMVFFDAGATIEIIDENLIKISVNAEMQLDQNSSRVKDSQIDVYEIVWDDEKRGQLENTAPQYRDDISVFEINGEILIISSKISRNNSIEIHVLKK